LLPRRQRVAAPPREQATTECEDGDGVPQQHSLSARIEVQRVFCVVNPSRHASSLQVRLRSKAY
jgi:hypothetical protein